MYAIIETGGKQYKVEIGTTVDVDLLDIEVGKKIEFTDLLNGAKVTAKVLEHAKGEKITVFKYKPKKNERKKQGHRTQFTKLSIEDIKPIAEKGAKK